MASEGGTNGGMVRHALNEVRYDRSGTVLALASDDGTVKTYVGVRPFCIRYCNNSVFIPSVFSRFMPHITLSTACLGVYGTNGGTVRHALNDVRYGRSGTVLALASDDGTLKTYVGVDSC